MFNWLKKKNKEREDLTKGIEEVREKAEEVSEGAKKFAEQGTEYGKKLADLGDRLEQKGEKLSEAHKELSELYKTLLIREQSLDERESTARNKEYDIEERMKNVRSEEIKIIARKAETRSQESSVKKETATLNNQKHDLEKRELVAEELAEYSRKSQKEYEEKDHQLKAKEDELRELEKTLSSRAEDTEIRKKETDKKFAKAKSLEEEMFEKKRTSEEDVEHIKEKLQEKIDEYNRKIADIENVKNTADAIKFDDSEEGRQAKIVVFDAITKAKKAADDTAKEFEQIREKYGKGTFKGFTIPLEQIDIEFKKFQSQVQQIQEHAKENNVEILMRRILDKIHKHLIEADKCKNSWEFAEAYWNICQGLTTCENYAILLLIIDENTETEHEGQDEENEPDYYKILDVPETATKKEIKTAFQRMIQRWHPDKAQTDAERTEFGEKTTNILKAKDILLNEEKRAKYDKKRKQSKS